MDSDLIYRAAKLLLGSCLVSFVPLDSIPLFAEKRASVSYQRGLLGPNGYDFFLSPRFTLERSVLRSWLEFLLLCVFSRSNTIVHV